MALDSINSAQKAVFYNSGKPNLYRSSIRVDEEFYYVEDTGFDHGADDPIAEMKICCTGDRSPFNRNRQILITNCHFCPHDCFLYKILRSSSVHEGVALDHVPHKIFDFAGAPDLT